MKLNNTDQKIIDAVIKKAEKVCPGSLEAVGIYGSVCTGDIHEKSDLDLLILINDDAGWQLSEGFILDDRKVGYDIYCTNWKMLKEDAGCKHAHLAKLMDSEFVYAADDATVRKISELKSEAEDILQSEKRFACVDHIIKDAKEMYADAMLAGTMEEVRMCAYGCISLLLDAVMLENGRYFRRGVKRTFEELDGMLLPRHFEDHIYDIIMAVEMERIREGLTALLKSVMEYAKHDRVKEQPSKSNLSGTYEEMYSNWRNKMVEAAGRNDIFSSFMNMASFQLMMDEIAADVAIERFHIMDRYNPADLTGNVEVFDDALNQYLQEYARAGISPKHFANVDEFVEFYLQD